MEPLPETEVQFIDTEALYVLLKKYDEQQCRDQAGQPLLTIVDFRNANHLASNNPPPGIATRCPVQTYLLDDILDSETRDKLPIKGKVVIVTETGSRDEFVIRYLAKYGFSSILGLKSGMRGWLKHRYPTK